MSATVLTVFTDGGSRNNPGQAAFGGVGKVADETVFEFSQAIGIATNNVAEYKALLHSFSLIDLYITQHPEIIKIEWKLDSKLVIEQSNKNWKVKEPAIKELVNQVWAQLEKLPIPYSISYVPRAENKRADELVNEALDNL